VTTWMTRLVHESNGRPFTQDEVNRIAHYVEFLNDAVTAVKKLEENQKWLIRHLSESVGARAVEWGLPKDPFTNDFAAFLAAIGHAVLSDDLEVIDHTVVRPCESLADALEVPRSEFAVLFEEAWRILTPRLDPASATRLQRYFDRAVEQLKATSEPASAVSADRSFPAMIEVLS
jgi:Phycobilisome protein